MKGCTEEIMLRLLQNKEIRIIKNMMSLYINLLYFQIITLLKLHLEQTTAKVRSIKPFYHTICLFITNT